MKHTPGKWTFEEVKSEKNLVYCLIKSDTGLIGFAGTYVWDKSRITKDEALANAKLIAAAPNLLECLIEAVESMQLETNNVDPKWIDTIKKATE